MIFDDPGNASGTADTMDNSHHYGTRKETMSWECSTGFNDTGIETVAETSFGVYLVSIRVHLSDLSPQLSGSSQTFQQSHVR